MTASPRSIALEQRTRSSATTDATAPARSPRARSGDERRRDRVVFPLLMLGILGAYALLQNPYWVPSGDSEVYIAAAREIALGHGYRFNGQPVAIVPPGWPAVMALVMAITPYVLPLKLLAMACTAGSLAITYWIARRWVPPGTAALAVALTAILSHVYQGTFWLISEGLFCLVTSATILVALQIREGQRQWWRIALLALLCSAAVSVRWAGLLGWLLVAAILVSGEWKHTVALATAGAVAAGTLLLRAAVGADDMPPWAMALGLGLACAVVLAGTIALGLWRDRRWVATLLAALFTFGAFERINSVLRLTAEEEAAVRAFGGADEGGAEEMVEPAEIVEVTDPAAPSPESGADTQAARSYSLITGTTATSRYTGRFLGWGRWVSWLYFQPLRAAAGSPLLEAAAYITGWILLALLILVAVVRARRLEWIWLAVLLYAVALALNWPLPNARYLVPVAGLMTLGILMAAGQLKSWAREMRWLRRAVVAATALFVGGVLLCNGALWAVEVAVARSDDFYGTYETGIHRELIAAGQFLRDQDDVGNREIAVTPRYDNLSRVRKSPFGLRVTNLLTGKAIVAVDSDYQSRDITGKLKRYLHREGIAYYLHQTPVSPWRVWHFRMGWWQRMRTGREPETIDTGWELYRVDGPDQLTRIPLPEPDRWPTRVPGLE